MFNDILWKDFFLIIILFQHLVHQNLRFYAHTINLKSYVNVKD